MKNSTRTWMSVAVIGLFAGCASRGNVEVLESRLRYQDSRLADIQAQLQTTQKELSLAREESRQLRGQLASNGEETLLPEQARILYSVSGIRFNSFLTGGFDGDDVAGDESLHVLLVPHDEDQELIKIPASIELELLDLSLPDDQQEIGYWSFDMEQSRDHWHSGFIGAGYLFRLPWQQTPRNSELLLHGRLITTDGRQFDTSQTIRITPPEQPITDPGITREEGRPSGEFHLPPTDPEYTEPVQTPNLIEKTGEENRMKERGSKPAESSSQAPLLPLDLDSRDPQGNQPRNPNQTETGRSQPQQSDSFDQEFRPFREENSPQSEKEDESPPGKFPLPEEEKAPIPTSDRWTDWTRPRIR